EEAVPLFKKALEIERGDKETLFLLGLSYRHLEQYEKAAAIFEKLTSLAPVKNKVFHELGVSYGRQDKLALAHYNFGIYFMRLREAKKARFHFEKADKLAQGDTALQKKIDRATQSLTE
ncbi:MAG: tetratricopeptide repeat protein, partial [Deltaproteobacteria bacterium]|nr:tetratricopeptide repeat protein [Deltaproteobacteria bacterium]